MKTLLISDSVDLSRIEQTLENEPISLAKEGEIVSVIISVEEFKLYQKIKKQTQNVKHQASKIAEFLDAVKRANSHATGEHVNEEDYYKQYS
jgi:uncharacterized coiled-coil DUF342 family protein